MTVFKGKLLPLLLICVMLFSLLPLCTAAASSLPSPTTVDAYCVINAEYQMTVLEKNSKKQIYPASTVKLMTALVAFSHVSDNLDRTITVTKEMLSDVSGRNMGLEDGEQIRISDLFYALLVGGYNDAAVFLAHITAGSVSAFCEQMNALAHSLGATDTNYTNPTGLHDDKMVTTAYDTALVALALAKNNTLFSMTNTVKYVIPKTNKSEDRTIYNRNPLITTGTTEEYYYSYAEGISVGATDEGGDCAITFGRIKSDLGTDVDTLPDELSYVCVVMGGRPFLKDDDTNYACVAAKTLLRYALVNYDLRLLYSSKQQVAEIPIRFSPTEESVGVKPISDLYALLHNDISQDNIDIEIRIPPTLLDAPIEKDMIVGTASAFLDGKLLDSTDLVTTDFIDAHGFLVFMYRVKTVTQHPVFITALILAVIGIIYLLLKKFPISKNKDKHKRNRYY